MKSVLPLKPKIERAQATQLAWWKAQIGMYLLADVSPSLIAEMRALLQREETWRRHQKKVRHG